MRMDSASSHRDRSSAGDLSTHSVTAETLDSVSLRTDSTVVNARTSTNGSPCYSVNSVESALSAHYSPDKKGIVSVFPDYFRLFGFLVALLPLVLLCCGCGPSKKQYAINEALLIDQTRILEDEIYRMRFEVQQLKTENDRLRGFVDKKEQATASEETSRSRSQKQPGKVPFDIPVDRATGRQDINARTLPKSNQPSVPGATPQRSDPQQEIPSLQQQAQSLQQKAQSLQQQIPNPQQEVQSLQQKAQSIQQQVPSPQQLVPGMQQQVPSPQQLVPGMQQQNSSPQQPNGQGTSNQPDNNGVRKILVIPKTVSYDGNNETLPSQIIVPRKPGR